MSQFYQNVINYLPDKSHGVFIEIGSDRLEGSTKFLAEAARRRGTVLHTVDIQSEPQSRIQHQAIVWHTELGSSWCKNTWPSIASQIELLYLDNYDFQYNYSEDHFIWNKHTYCQVRGPDWPEEFTTFADLSLEIQQECRDLLNLPIEFLTKSLKELYTEKGLGFTNEQCQQEHFSQLLALMPWINDQTLIVFDDTFLQNGCWAGKNGPGVVYLKTQGFSIIDRIDTAVIMKK